MHTLPHKIEEDLGFSKVITAKQVSEKNLKFESWSSIWTLETITSRAQEILQICTLI
jgi:hypothetical protein